MARPTPARAEYDSENGCNPAQIKLKQSLKETLWWSETVLGTRFLTV
jgi:hypothetical protein